MPKVFLSSTIKDLEAYRTSAIDIIKSLEMDVVYQEAMLPNGELSDPNEFSKKQMDGCDWFVAIIAFRYGHVVEGEEKSVTETEYDHAVKLLREDTYKKAFVMLAGNLDDFDKSDDIYKYSDREKPESSENEIQKQRTFRQRISKNVLKYFNSHEDYKQVLDEVLKKNLLPMPSPDEVTLSLLNDYKELTESAKRFREDSNRAMRELVRIQRYKDLHDIVHTFRKDVVSPASMSVKENESESYIIRRDKFDEYDNKFRIFHFQAEQASFLLGERLENEAVYNLKRVQQLKSLFYIAPDSSEDFVNETSVSEIYKEKLKDLLDAIDNLLDHFDEHIQNIAGEFKKPAEKVLKNLRRPINKGHWSFNDQREKNRWVELLRGIDASRNELQLTLEAHGKWQELHGQLKKVDKANESVKELLTIPKTERTSPEGCQVIVSEFTQSSNEVFEKFCEPKGSTLKLGLCEIGTDYNDVILLRQSDLDSFKLALKEFYFAIADAKSLSDDDIHKFDSNSKAAKILLESNELYSKFRREFDKSFYSVDIRLKDMCDKATNWIDELYELLDDIHESILRYEEHVKNNSVVETGSER